MKHRLPGCIDIFFLFFFFLKCALIQRRIKENVSRENYGNAFWHYDNKCHPISPKMRSLFDNHKASLTVFLKSHQNLRGCDIFQPPPPLDHLWVSNPMKISRCVFGSNYAKALPFTTTVKGNIDSP